MKQLVTPLLKDFFAASTEEVEVDATKTIYVSDLHDHDHEGHEFDHEEGCECGACCSEHDHVELIDATLPSSAVSTTITQGYTTEVAHTIASDYTPGWDFDFQVDAPTAAVTGSGVGSDGAMQSGYTSGGDAASSFNIMITYGGDLKGELAEAFSKAADYFSQIIDRSDHGIRRR